MSKPKHVSIPARVRTIFRESAEAAPKAYLSILLFTVIGLVISSLNYVITGGEEFANAYSVLTLLVGQISVFYITQSSVIHGTPPAIRQMIKTKSFWIYALGVVLLSATFLLTFKLSLASVVNGWGGFMNLLGIKPEAYGFPDMEKIAITTSFFLTIFFARKLAFVLPEIVAGKPLNFVASWKLMKAGNIPFWITLIFVMSPPVALAVGYTYVRTPYLITQIVTQILTYFLMTMHAIVFSATAAVFWKEIVGEKDKAVVA